MLGIPGKSEVEHAFDAPVRRELDPSETKHSARLEEVTFLPDVCLGERIRSRNGLGRARELIPGVFALPRRHASGRHHQHADGRLTVARWNVPLARCLVAREPDTKLVVIAGELTVLGKRGLRDERRPVLRRWTHDDRHFGEGLGAAAHGQKRKGERAG
jgi:hypothetical protein